MKNYRVKTELPLVMGDEVYFMVGIGKGTYELQEDILIQTKFEMEYYVESLEGKKVNVVPPKTDLDKLRIWLIEMMDQEARLDG